MGGEKGSLQIKGGFRDISVNEDMKTTLAFGFINLCGYGFERGVLAFCLVTGSLAVLGCPDRRTSNSQSLVYVS